MSTWILLRGLTREKRHWGDFPDQLQQGMPGAQVIPLELPGSGDLNALSSPTRIAEMASGCREALARIGAPPPYYLLAMSMGAMVATAWAQEHPDEIQACVLINTSFGSFSPLHHRLRPRAWGTVLRILLTPSPEVREQLIFGLTTRLVIAKSQVVEAWAAIGRSRPVTPLNALRQILAAARFRAPASASVPVLILTGAGDQLVDPYCSQEIARRWHCAIAMHTRAGHDLPLDDSAWVVAKVKEWVDLKGHTS